MIQRRGPAALTVAQAAFGQIVQQFGDDMAVTTDLHHVRHTRVHGGHTFLGKGPTLVCSVFRSKRTFIDPVPEDTGSMASNRKEVMPDSRAFERCPDGTTSS